VINRVVSTSEAMLKQIRAGGDIRDTILQYSFVNITDTELNNIVEAMRVNKDIVQKISKGVQREANVNFHHGKLKIS
jgi:hypothetical protein